MTNLVMLVGPQRYRLTRQALESLQLHTDLTSLTCTFVCDLGHGVDYDFRTATLIRNIIDRNQSTMTALPVWNSGHTLSQLKNLGVAWSEQRWGRGDWLHIGDSDVYFMPGWLEKLVMVAEAAANTNFELFGGQIHPFHAQTHIPIDRAADGRFGWTEHDILDGPSWFMDWDTWMHSGPFDRTTASGVCQSEEYSFCERLKRDGGRIGVISPHVVIHTGLTHLNAHDAPGRREREALIPEGVLAE